MITPCPEIIFPRTVFPQFLCIRFLICNTHPNDRIRMKKHIIFSAALLHKAFHESLRYFLYLLSIFCI